ncbi:MAG: hypothetical protein DSZ12_06225 [Sulfurovum sp.]|nr:MAG: hypothetical protein DSZ12_06225 [Sulfurovum sp.]
MNISDVKRELSGDEKVLESVFKIETLYKKYKFVIWAIFLGVLFYFIGKSVTQNIQQSKYEEANDAYLILEKNPDDAKALATLKEKNPTLFEIFSYTKASKNEDIKTLTALQKSDNFVVSDGSTYVQGTLEKKQVDSTLYREIAILDDAYLNIKAGDIKSANEKLELIDEDSKLYTLASLLKHSTLKGKK